MGSNDFDAIVVGAGHNGMCTAAYLQRAGFKTLLCERRHEEGGGVNTEEPVAPGFYHNMHAQFMEFIDYMPFYWDFELEKLGARMIYPEAQAGITFSDGRPPIVLHRPDLLDRTHESISRYSKADADTFVELKRKTMSIDQMFATNLYSPPMSLEERKQMESMAEGMLPFFGLEPVDMFKSPKVIIDEKFETDELRTPLPDLHRVGYACRAGDGRHVFCLRGALDDRHLEALGWRNPHPCQGHEAGLPA